MPSDFLLAHVIVIALVIVITLPFLSIVLAVAAATTIVATVASLVLGPLLLLLLVAAPAVAAERHWVPPVHGAPTKRLPARPQPVPPRPAPRGRLRRPLGRCAPRARAASSSPGGLRARGPSACAAVAGACPTRRWSTSRSARASRSAPARGSGARRAGSTSASAGRDGGSATSTRSGSSPPPAPRCLRLRSGHRRPLHLVARSRRSSSRRLAPWPVWLGLTLLLTGLVGAGRVRLALRPPVTAARRASRPAASHLARRSRS